jgi:hypothetical protein
MLNFFCVFTGTGELPSPFIDFRIEDFALSIIVFDEGKRKVVDNFLSLEKFRPGSQFLNFVVDFGRSEGLFLEDDSSEVVKEDQEKVFRDEDIF